MGAFTDAAAQLRVKVEEAVLEEITRIGPQGFKRSVITKRFAEHGVPRSTVYRWISEIMATGRPYARLSAELKAAAAERAARSASPSKEIAAEALQSFPNFLYVDAATAAILGPRALLARLQLCVEAAEQVMAYSRTVEGCVREWRPLLAASDHLRRTVETEIKLHLAIRTIGETDACLSEMARAMAQVALSHPAAAEDLLGHWRAITMQWSIPQ